MADYSLAQLTMLARAGRRLKAREHLGIMRSVYAADAAVHGGKEGGRVMEKIQNQTIKEAEES